MGKLEVFAYGGDRQHSVKLGTHASLKRAVDCLIAARRLYKKNQKYVLVREGKIVAFAGRERGCFFIKYSPSERFRHAEFWQESMQEFRKLADHCKRELAMIGHRSSDQHRLARLKRAREQARCLFEKLDLLVQQGEE